MNTEHMTRGGDGSHWDGCEESHWDCAIERLIQRVAELEVMLKAKDIWIHELETRYES